MKVWKKVAENLTLKSNTDGSEKAHALALQDWGLEVKEALYVLVALNRSSANAKVGARHDDGWTCADIS